MDRRELSQWLEDHPGCVWGNPDVLLDRCEREVRRRAEEDAWLHAKDLIELRRTAFDGDWGDRASTSLVARELCRELAEQMKQSEPVLEQGCESHLAGEHIFTAFEPLAREQLRHWILQLAREEEHRVWEEIVRFTDARGRSLAREGRLADAGSERESRSLSETAARVADILAEDCEAHAHPGAG